jgi:hypothetical protein
MKSELVVALAWVIVIPGPQCQSEGPPACVAIALLPVLERVTAVDVALTVIGPFVALPLERMVWQFAAPQAMLLLIEMVLPGRIPDSADVLGHVIQPPMAQFWAVQVLQDTLIEVVTVHEPEPVQPVMPVIEKIF